MAAPKQYKLSLLDGSWVGVRGDKGWYFVRKGSKEATYARPPGLAQGDAELDAAWQAENPGVPFAAPPLPAPTQSPGAGTQPAFTKLLALPSF